MLGVMLAWKAPPLIISRETMHNVWGMIEWILNTFIFLLAGLIIGDRVLEKVKLEDVGYLFVLYLLLMLVRCFVIALLFPLLSSMGHRCTRNEAIFMSWAGLRGVSYYSMIVMVIMMVMYSDHL
jgi:NhaP-type Na+/H+ or K+/H+ antiporter